jgi:hypothetical protein
MLSLLLLDTNDAAELVASVPGCRGSLLLKLTALCSTLTAHACKIQLSMNFTRNQCRSVDRWVTFHFLAVAATVDARSLG